MLGSLNEHNMPQTKYIAPKNQTILASAARTTTQTSADLGSVGCTGLIAVLDMTTVGTGSVTLTIDGKDSASGKWFNLITGAAVVTNSTNVYRIYPGLTPVANATVSDVVPSIYRMVVTANNANSATYSLGVQLIP